MKKPITIYQVARECGVSVSTVSRVLNGNPNVSTKTRNLVNSVIEKYHFTPNGIAQSMNSNRTKTFGVIMPDITYPFFSLLFLEIERFAAEAGYSVMLANTLHGGSARGVDSSFSEDFYFKAMVSRRVDGIIIVGGEVDRLTISPDYVAALNALSDTLPVVIIGQTIPDCKCVFVERNLAGGVQSLVNHLVTLGRRSIGFIGGREDLLQTAAQLERYRLAMGALSLPVEEENIALSGYYARDGYETVMRMIRSGRKMTEALIAVNDQVAIGAIRALHDAGISVPGDVAVASCDMFPDGEYITPRLTSLDQQHEYLGRMAVMTLMTSINGIREPVTISHNPRLMIRESCGAGI